MNICREFDKIIYSYLDRNLATYYSDKICSHNPRSPLVYFDLLQHSTGKPVYKCRHYTKYNASVINSTLSHYLEQQSESLVIHLYHCTTNLIDGFKSIKPEYQALELKRISDALKLTSQHRIRVYKIQNTIVVFSSKQFLHNPELHDKVIAVLPLLIDVDESVKHFYKEWLTLPAEQWDANYSAYIASQEWYKNLAYLRFTNVIKDVYDTRNIQAARDVQRIQLEYDEYVQEIQTKYKQLLEAQQRTFYLENIGLQDEELQATAKLLYNTGRILALTQAERGILKFRVKTPCLYFDKAAASTVINRWHNISDVTLAVVKDVFVAQAAQIIFDTEISYNLNESIVKATRRGPVLSTLSNPHHFYYDCWGNYKQPIQKALANFYLEEAFMLTINSAASLNFYDGAVCNRLYELLSGTCNLGSCIRRDNLDYTIAEYYDKYLREGTTNETN